MQCPASDGGTAVYDATTTAFDGARHVRQLPHQRGRGAHRRGGHRLVDQRRMKSCAGCRRRGTRPARAGVHDRIFVGCRGAPRSHERIAGPPAVSPMPATPMTSRASTAASARSSDGRCGWMTGVRVRTAFVAAALLTALAACGEQDERPLPPRKLQIATGTSGGVYAAYGAGLARAIIYHVPADRGRHADERVRCEPASARAAVYRLPSRSPTRPTTRSAPATASDRPVPLVALARLYDNYVQVIARAGSPVTTWRSCGGRVVSVGAPGSGTAVIAERILALRQLTGSSGPRRVRLDIANSADALATGEIDAFFWSVACRRPRSPTWRSARRPSRSGCSTCAA